MPAIGPRSEWLPRPYLSHFLTNESIFTEVIPWPTAKTPTAAASAWRC